MTESKIYECRVYTPGMKLKKVHTAEECQTKYWQDEGVQLTKSVEKYMTPYERKIKCGEVKGDGCGKEVIAKTSYTQYCQDNSCKNKRKRESARKRAGDQFKKDQAIQLILQK